MTKKLIIIDTTTCYIITQDMVYFKNYNFVVELLSLVTHIMKPDCK